MPAKFSLFAVAALPIIPIALACGGDDGGGGIKVPDASVKMDGQGSALPDAFVDNCTATTNYMTVTFAGSNSQNAQTMGSGSQQAIQYVGKMNADPMPDFLDIELYAGYGAYATAITAKSVPLTGVETSYKDCGACVLILTDVHQQGSGAAATDIYMAKSGTLNMTSVTTNFTGTLSNVTFHKVDIGSDGTTSDLGSCSSQVGGASMNTPLVAGSATAPMNIEFDGQFIDGRATILHHRIIK